MFQAFLDARLICLLQTLVLSEVRRGGASLDSMLETPPSGLRRKRFRAQPQLRRCPKLMRKILPLIISDRH